MSKGVPPLPYDELAQLQPVPEAVWLADGAV